MSYLFCRLCGATPVLPLAVDAGGHWWYRCDGCGCRASARAYAAPGRPPEPDLVIERSPFPLLFVTGLHAHCPRGHTLDLRTVWPVEPDNPLSGEYAPGRLFLLAPAWLEKQFRDVGFAAARRQAGNVVTWRLTKTDGL